MSENAIITATPKSVMFKSEKLNAVTVEIASYITEVQTKAHTNHIAISKALARVANEKLYVEDGFSSALQYAMETFGWKKANAYAMMQVGTKLNAGELPEGNFSVSQYREMLPLSKEAAEEAIEAGIINEEMSAKDIRAEVEVLKPKKERKAKPEKVYKWYLDGMEERVPVIMTESGIEEAEEFNWARKVSVKIPDIENEESGEKTLCGYLVCIGWEIRFYARGAEVTEEEEEVTEENAE